jgi:hypothetical protein
MAVAVERAELIDGPPGQSEALSGRGGRVAEQLHASLATCGSPAPIPSSDRPPVSTEIVCASHAVSRGARSELAITKFPTCRVVVAPAASASAGMDDSSCRPSGMSRVE